MEKYSWTNVAQKHLNVYSTLRYITTTANANIDKANIFKHCYFSHPVSC